MCVCIVYTVHVVKERARRYMFVNEYKDSFTCFLFLIVPSSLITCLAHLHIRQLTHTHHYIFACTLVSPLSINVFRSSTFCAAVFRKNENQAKISSILLQQRFTSRLRRLFSRNLMLN